MILEPVPERSNQYLLSMERDPISTEQVSDLCVVVNLNIESLHFAICLSPNTQLDLRLLGSSSFRVGDSDGLGILQFCIFAKFDFLDKGIVDSEIS